MNQTTTRGVPLREDRWQPQDELLNSVIDKLIDDAHHGAKDSGGGSGPLLVAGGMMLAVIGVTIGAGTGNPMLAFGIVVALAIAGFAYTALNAESVHVNKLSVLDPIGGPGNLPAGYLVYPRAWRAGMREYLMPITDRQFRIAVKLCREHPGSVSDVLRLVKRAEKHAYNTHTGHEITEHDVFRIAHRWTAEHARNSPTMVMQVAAR
ncbi:hypothetical protein ACTI_83720 [Actinoplanes sp. OR16]|uniref:hypothetical protein n=1 Tax=Actinoplanes sp. OR16 TaxID=946334 RepID=UPI000F6F80E1|nr:hypothetical protein [Actinoplanes sp. OR16]BBH71687.1 hypothetical protein ACTI_83720 [Actinoplanes sp. OR16]